MQYEEYRYNWGIELHQLTLFNKDTVCSLSHIYTLCQLTLISCSSPLFALSKTLTIFKIIYFCGTKSKECNYYRFLMSHKCLNHTTFVFIRISAHILSIFSKPICPVFPININVDYSFYVVNYTTNLTFMNIAELWHSREKYFGTKVVKHYTIFVSFIYWLNKAI